MIIINLKIVILILILTLFFMPIGLCENIKDIKELNNTKIYDENNKIISIYNKNIDKSMDIKLIYTSSDINKFIKIVEITNYIEYIPDKNNFITKTKKIYGKNDVYKIEYFIEKYNYTFKNIIINKTIFNNKTGKNESKLINKSIIKDIIPYWVKFEFYNKQILKNESFKLKIIHYKKPELGFFKIQTIPIFKNIECKEFTWWNGNWNLKRAILINNTNGDNVINYQLRSVNLSQYQINASSARIINESSGLIQSHWNETIDSNGNLEYVWCNFSNLNNGSWINNTYYLYYQSNSIVNSISNIETTFIQGSEFNDLVGWSQQAGVWTVLDGLLISPTITNGYLRSDTIISELSYIIEIKGKTINNIRYIILAEANNPLSTAASLALQLAINSDVILIRSDWDVHTSPVTLNNNTWYIGHAQINSGNNYGKVYSTNRILLGISPQQINDGSGTGNYWGFFESGDAFYIDWALIRKYTNNKPELWTVGNIEYPEVLDMNCSLKIITHLTEKEIKIVNMTGDIVNVSKTNECINLSYDSYMIYMANPVKISSFTELLNTIDNVFIQFFLFAFLIVIGIIFFTFLQIIKNKGFKGVTK